MPSFTEIVLADVEINFPKGTLNERCETASLQYCGRSRLGYVLTVQRLSASNDVTWFACARDWVVAERAKLNHDHACMNDQDWLSDHSPVFFSSWPRKSCSLAKRTGQWQVETHRLLSFIFVFRSVSSVQWRRLSFLEGKGKPCSAFHMCAEKLGILSQTQCAMFWTTRWEEETTWQRRISRTLLPV